MSQARLDVLQRGFDHTARTGELLGEIMTPDVIWDTTTFSTAGLTLKKCVGFDEAQRWLAQWADAFESWKVDVEEIHDNDDQVVTFMRQHAKPKHGGPEVEMRFAQVWFFRDDLVERMEMYLDRAEALAAAGIEE
jgi:ketosteroid isomerase-like protein